MTLVKQLREESARHLSGHPSPARQVSELLDSAAKALATIGVLDFEDTKARILGALMDYRDLGPEEDESWESWYYAAFDMASEKVADLLKSIPSPALAASPATQDEEGGRDA